MTTTLTRHVVTDLPILYFGTPVVLLSTQNPDGTPNLAPNSSVSWLGDQAMLGVSRASQSWSNMRRTGEVTLGLPSADLVAAVDRLALTTGVDELPDYKVQRGYRHVADKFGTAALTPEPSDVVGPPRVAECPIALECVVESMAEEPERMPIVEVRVVRSHAHPDVLRNGRTDRVDPDRWRPLIMSFQKFYGLADAQLHPSRLSSIDEDRYRVHR